MPSRIILHIDLDAFFASVEERENPKLKGKPVVVGANPKGGKGRGVVSTCNYKAREYGIRSGMPISIAYRKCPDAVFLPVNWRLYSNASRKVMEIIRSRFKQTEQVSVDEMFIDVTDSSKDFSDALKTAKNIREEIYRKEKLTCSIGVGPNKLVAKIASDYKKPRGLTAVKPSGVKRFLGPLSVRKIPGIGPKTAQHLKALGIETIKQLADCPDDKLSKFGSYAFYMKSAARGIDESPVMEIEGVKSIGREVTLQKDTNKKEVLEKVLRQVAGQAFEDLKKEKVSFKTVSIKVRFEGFETFTRAKTLHAAVNSEEILQKVARELFREFLGSEKKIRLIGVRMTNLKEDASQKTL